MSKLSGQVRLIVAENSDDEVYRIKEIYSEYKNLINNIKFIEVTDFDDYKEKLINMNFQDIDICIMCMAISDYKPLRTIGKISSNEEYLNINMEKCPKIIQNLRGKDENAFIVGFKLSSNSTEEEIINNVLNWMKSRRVDMCVANDMRGRREDYREVYLLTKNSPEYKFFSGENVSESLVDQIIKSYKIKLSK